MTLKDEDAYQFTMGDQMLYTSPDDKLLMTDMEPEDGDWTSEFKPVMSNDGRGFIIQHRKKSIHLKVEDTDSKKKQISWENSDDKLNDPSVF